MQLTPVVSLFLILYTTFAMAKDNFVLPLTFPMLQIEVTEPVGNLKVWEVKDGARGALLFSSFAYWERWQDAKDKQAKRHRNWLIRLPHAPERILVMMEGEGAVETMVTKLQVVTEKGKVILPALDVKPTVAEARVTGLPFQAHQLNLYEFVFPADLVKGLRDDESRWPKTRIGVYYIPYPVSDPSMVPPGYPVFTMPAATVAEYDFSIPQANSPGMVKRDFQLEVKKLNPNHRIIPRLFHPYTGCHLDYYYDPAGREKIRKHFADTVKQIGPDVIHAVTLSEEENGNLLRGLYWTDNPPDWAEKYAARYEADTGKKFTWATKQHIYGNDDFLKWMLPAIKFYYNDLYTYLKKTFPGMKVLQYIALANDGSGIAWHEASEFKADGWVLWSWWMKEEGVLMKVRRGNEPSFEVWMLADRLAKSLQRVREAGVPNDEIYHCGWGHLAPPEMYDAVDQVKRQQMLGVPNSFLFYPLYAFMDPKPGDDGSAWKQGGKPWTFWRELRLRVLDCRRDVKASR